MQRFILIAGTLACIALYLLTTSTDSTSTLSGHFWTIVTFCALLILAMCGVILRYIYLIIRYKNHRVFGSQITANVYVGGGVARAVFIVGVGKIHFA